MIVYYLIPICLLVALFLDELYYTIMKRQTRFEGSVDLSRISQVSFTGPESNPFSRRSVFNPSILFDDGWHMVARNTRGRRLAQCIWQLALEDDVVEIGGVEYRASMIYYQLDRRFKVVREVPVYVRTEPYPGARSGNPLWWQGEDPRVFKDENGKLKIQATVHQSDGVIKLGHGPLTYNKGYLTWEISRIIQDPRSQKNWSAIPLTSEGRQLFLDRVSPDWSVVTLDERGVAKPVLKTNKFAKWFGKLRCTTGCKPFKPGTFLTCLHTTNPYRTILCEINSQTLLPRRISEPLEFKYPDTYIEFPSGLETLDGNVYLGLGFNDTHFEIRKLSIDVVDGLLTIDVTK